MDWGTVADRVLGFLPYRSVILAALGTSGAVLLLQYVMGKINKMVEPPWMKEKNQKQRDKQLAQLRQRSMK